MNALERIQLTLSRSYHVGYKNQKAPLYLTGKDAGKEILCTILEDDFSQLINQSPSVDDVNALIKELKERLAEISSTSLYSTSENTRREIAFHDQLLSSLWNIQTPLENSIEDELSFASKHHLWAGLNTLLHRLTPEQQKEIPMNMQVSLVSKLQHHIGEYKGKSSPHAKSAVDVFFSLLTKEDIQSHENIHPLCAFVTCDELSRLMSKGIVDTSTVLRWVDQKSMHFLSEVGKGLVQFWSDHGKMSSQEVGQRLSAWAHQESEVFEVFSGQDVRIHSEGSFFDQWSIQACQAFQRCVQKNSVGDRDVLIKGVTPSQPLPYGGTEGAVLLFIAIASGLSPSWIKQKLSFWAGGNDPQSHQLLWNNVWNLQKEPFLNVSSMMSAQINYAINVSKSSWWFTHNLDQRQHLLNILTNQINALPLWDNQNAEVGSLSPRQRKVVGSFVSLAYKRCRDPSSDLPLSPTEGDILLKLLLRKAKNHQAILEGLIWCVGQKVISVTDGDLDRISQIASQQPKMVLTLSTARQHAAAPSPRRRI